MLPVAGAIVGIYSGLAAGLFASMIRLVRGFAQLPHTLELVRHGSDTGRLPAVFGQTSWHPELIIVGAPVALGALGLSRVILPGGPRDKVKRRLRVLSLLVLGALGLYYPLVALAAVNRVLGPEVPAEAVPFWVVLIAPPLGGALVGWLLRRHPEAHGHGVPEVVMAVKSEESLLDAPGGLLKLFASAITIGSGGSAGREGPIVFGGAAFGSSVGRTLGFSRKELSILMASGAGAGIAASFNAPIAGAVFALEIILRDFELKVFSPIILASVTATMVGRGVMGQAPMLRRIGYQMVSGWEGLAYAALGLLCGLVAYAFVRLLHLVEAFFSGKQPYRLSAFLGRQPVAIRAALGGLCVGILAWANPTVWGTGHESANLAAQGALSLMFLLGACVLKVLGTSITLGSGGSGGTFFPATVMGAMAGGAFGIVLHALFPNVTAPSGAYAMVGMGGVVAGFTRGPFTGMMMIYELSGNYAIILPLMVTCTIASALCHTLLDRKNAPVVTDADLLHRAQVGELVTAVEPVPQSTRVRELVERLMETDVGALPVLDATGQPTGVVQLHHLREVWRDETLSQMLNAADVRMRVHPVSATDDLATALERMDHDDVDALPVLDRPDSPAMITRAAIRRYLRETRARIHAEAAEPVAPTEV